MNVNKQYTLHDAVFKGDIDNIDRLISEGHDVNEIYYLNERYSPYSTVYGTPLNVLTRYRHELLDYSEPNLNKELIVIAEKLLQAGANPNIAGSPHNGYLPLYQTVKYYGNIALVELLLRYQADPNGVYGEPDNTPLIHAIRYENNAEMTRLLLTKADPAIPDRDGVTPLEHALHGVMINSSINAKLNLTYLLSHPKINPDTEEVQKRIVNTVMRTCIFNLLDNSGNSVIQARVIGVICAYVLGGFNLDQDSLYYSASKFEQLNCIQRLQEEIASVKQVIEDEDEEEGRVQRAEEFGLLYILDDYDEDKLASTLQEKIFPFITKTIIQAEKIKAERIKPLDPWKAQLHKYPVFERQFLLASKEEREAISSKLEQLKGIKFDTLNRLFFSYQAQQKDFWALKAVWDLQYIGTQVEKSRMTSKFFQLPPELFQRILKEIVQGPYKSYLFGKEFNEVVIEPQCTSALEPPISFPRWLTSVDSLRTTRFF
jgi:ankyrin repeat protein